MDHEASGRQRGNDYTDATRPAERPDGEHSWHPWKQVGKKETSFTQPLGHEAPRKQSGNTFKERGCTDSNCETDLDGWVTTYRETKRDLGMLDPLFGGGQGGAAKTTARVRVEKETTSRIDAIEAIPKEQLAAVTELRKPAGSAVTSPLSTYRETKRDLGMFEPLFDEGQGGVIPHFIQFTAAKTTARVILEEETKSRTDAIEATLKEQLAIVAELREPAGSAATSPSITYQETERDLGMFDPLFGEGQGGAAKTTAKVMVEKETTSRIDAVESIPKEQLAAVTELRKPAGSAVASPLSTCRETKRDLGMIDPLFGGGQGGAAKTTTRVRVEKETTSRIDAIEAILKEQLAALAELRKPAGSAATSSSSKENKEQSKIGRAHV